MPVLIPRYTHAAVCHGAAMLAVKAASTDSEGKSEDLWSIMDRMSKPGKAVYPRQDEWEKKLLGAKYKVFLEMCGQQRTFRGEVDEVIKGWKKA